uniref:Uncharacterized protein n=1 Tax=Rhizophora mucronata TaxID=61149 RepID=A0A2P2N9G8_RHIMU
MTDNNLKKMRYGHAA